MLFDSLLEFGGRPANYSEFRGNPTVHKITGLTKIILSKKGVRGLFIAQNITSNTQTDLVAQAVVDCLHSLGLDISRLPVIVRQAGVNDKKAYEIFLKAGIESYGDEITLVEASRRMVDRMREAYPGYDEEGYLQWQY
jgi:succinyl-CoA synthetase beta subunit/citryl-CoA synthetase large subunit